MSESFNETETGRNADAGRLRIKGIVEAEAHELEKAGERAPASSFEGWVADELAFREQDWSIAADRVLKWSRRAAIFIFAVMLLGWPAGTIWGHRQATGSFDGLEFWPTVAYPAAMVFAIVVPAIILLLGYMFSKQLRMMGAAESIATVAQQFMQPEESAIYNVDAVGHAVRGQMEAINSGIDDALIRLASVEAMIRKHVDAIDAAGVAIESQTSSAVAKVADERSRLISLTEQLNAKADDFATAIALKAQAGIEAINESSDVSAQAEQALEARLQRLEGAASSALESFSSLTSALNDADDTVNDKAARIEKSAEEIRRSTDNTARAAEAAAESAATNAANLAGITKRAADQSKSSADDAIAFATHEAERVAEAAAIALETVRGATSKAVQAAAEDAAIATEAADQVGEAAQKAMTAAQQASEEVRKAGVAANKSAEDALSTSKIAKEHSEQQQRQLLEARASLEQENARLETLIEEQRQRADRLAEAIATQTERLSKLAEVQLREQEAASRPTQVVSEPSKSAAPRRQHAEPSEVRAPAQNTGPRRTARTRKETAKPNRLDEMAASIARPKDHHPAASPERSERANRQDSSKAKSDVSWREILTATDDAEPIELRKEDYNGTRPAAPDADEAMQVIHDLQSFTLTLEHQLYGEPPVALRERFDRGDRNIFANRLLRLNEADVKRRIRMETAKSKPFEAAIHEFLQGFERLLEDATTSETADEELEEYLSSPLGRVYLLIGATVGYFA